MDTAYHYANLKNRSKGIIENEAKGLRMISDTFDKDWLKGSEPHGVMVFTDKPENTTLHRDLAAEIDALKADVQEIKKAYL